MTEGVATQHALRMTPISGWKKTQTLRTALLLRRYGGAPGALFGVDSSIGEPLVI